MGCLSGTPCGCDNRGPSDTVGAAVADGSSGLCDHRNGFRNVRVSTSPHFWASNEIVAEVLPPPCGEGGLAILGACIRSGRCDLAWYRALELEVLPFVAANQSEFDKGLIQTWENMSAMREGKGIQWDDGWCWEHNSSLKNYSVFRRGQWIGFVSTEDVQDALFAHVPQPSPGLPQVLRTPNQANSACFAYP